MPEFASDEVHACPLCGGPMRLALQDVTDSSTGEPFAIYRCSTCGVGQTVPSPEDLARYYRGYHGNRHGITAGYRTWRRMLLVRRIAGTGGGRRLLDVGCGDGRFLIAAKHNGWQAVGTEIEPTQAAALGLDVRREIDEFSADAPFDCVTFWHSLEHLSQPMEVLQCARERLRPGGYVFIAVPDAGGWQARIFGRRWFHLDVPRHLFHFNRQSLPRLLETTGFNLVGEWHHEIEYDLIGWSQTMLNLLAKEPNVFLSTVTNRPVRASLVGKTAHLAGGLLLTAAAIPITLVSSAAGRGGTLIVAATK